MRPIGIRRIAKHLGVKLSSRAIYWKRRHQQIACGWDGRTIATRVERDGPPREAMMLLHEMAHWLVCPRSRRSKPEFGLGDGGEGFGNERLIPVRAADAEEKVAGLLAVLMARDSGIGDPYWADRGDPQTAFQSFLADWWVLKRVTWKPIVALQRLGFLDEHGETPIACLRRSSGSQRRGRP